MPNHRIAVLMYYTNYNRNSMNSLLGSLEMNPDICADVFFANSEKEVLLNLRRLIGRYGKIVVSFSLFTEQFSKIGSFIAKLEEIRGNCRESDIIFVAGGPHPSGDPRGTLDAGFDIVFVGESEESFPQFLLALQQNGDIYDVKGLYIKDESGHAYTGKAKQVNLDDFPPFSVKYKKFGPIEITRGCPFCCFYCQTPQLFGAKVRHRSEDVILEWVKVMRKHKLRDIRFVSPDAFAYGSNDGKELNLVALESLFSKIHESIKPNGRQFIGTFPSEVRPEHVTRDTIEIVKKYGSNKSIILGAQTGSLRMLKMINRSHTLEDVFNAVDIAVENKIVPHVDFIFGLPGEKEEDVNATIEAIKKLASKGATIHTHVFTPLPQTVFYMMHSGEPNKKIKKLIGELSRKGLAYGNMGD